MSEERLTEISSAICKSGGHIWPMIHLMNMDEQERTTFLQYVKEYVSCSEHPNMELVYAIVDFCRNYLESKNIDVCKLIKNAEKEECEVVRYFESLLPSQEQDNSSQIKRK